MTPDFAQWLLATPEGQRRGFVFHLGEKPDRQLGRSCVGHKVSAIGKAAGVKVKTDPSGAVKFASAHDLRRSFGTRWASRVKPAMLQLLMRHSSIDTTLRYYVDQDADDVAGELCAGFGNSFGNRSPKAEATSRDFAAAAANKISG
jgi:integrase